MGSQKLSDKPPKQSQPKTWCDLYFAARVHLLIGGLLTDAESNRVHQRMLKRIGKEGKRNG